MKHELIIKNSKILLASLILFSLVLPVGTFAAEPVKGTIAGEDERLKKTGVESTKNPLKACLFRIPFNLGRVQQKLAEEECHKVAVEGAETSFTN